MVNPPTHHLVSTHDYKWMNECVKTRMSLADDRGARPGAKQIAPGVDSNSLAFFQILSTIPWGTDSPVSWTSMESGLLIAPSCTSKSDGDLVRSVSATFFKREALVAWTSD